jgi:hypothetical protein
MKQTAGDLVNYRIALHPSFDLSLLTIPFSVSLVSGLNSLLFFHCPLSATWAHVLTGEGHQFLAACQNEFLLKRIFESFLRAHKPCNYFALAQKTTDRTKNSDLNGLYSKRAGTTQKQAGL